MRTLKFLALILIFSGKYYSQSFGCGTDILISMEKENVKDYEEQVRLNNLKIKQYIAEHYAPGLQNRPPNNNYTIPVVFHIIHPSGQAYGTGANISYLQLQSQMDALNAAFAKNYPAYNGQTHPAYAQNTNIRFCLARIPAPANAAFYNGPLGIEYGVRRYADNAATMNSQTNASGTALVALTHPNATYFPFTDYLNIWVVTNIASNSAGTIMGYATPPGSSFPTNGIVMRSDVTGDNSAGGNFPLGYGLTQGKILAHEAGHYLNLMHIFQGGCTGANAAGSATDACDLNGDFICDTEPCTTQNILCNQPIPNTCTANYPTGTTNMDMIESYMSYAEDDCLNTFTMDQTQRMWATLNTSRFNLWQLTNLGATGVSGPSGCNPALLFTSLSVTGNCTNSLIAVTNPTAGNTASSWTWTAPGSNMPTANTPTISITYAIPGLHKIKLAVSDGTTTIVDSVVVSVTNCSLDPNKLNRSNWLFGDYASVSFATGQPVPNNVAVVNNTIKCFENAACMSDSLGNLLFYSNGKNLWRSNHTQVNVTPLFGWDLIIPSPNGYNGTSVGGFMSFPAPKKPNKYFIVCVPPYEIKGNPTQGPFAKINYVIYDAVSQTVTPFQSLTHPAINYVSAFPNFGLTENLNVVPHCNGVDYWIVARGTNVAGTAFNYYSFLVNANGLSPTTPPVLSGPYSLTLVTQNCDMKSNNTGDKFVTKGQNKNTSYIWDFNQSTGAVSNPVLLPTSAVGSQTNSYAGVIFSPSNQYVYSVVSGGIDMIDVANNSIVKTITPVNGYHNTSMYMEIGPDNNIYMAGMSNTFGSALAQITNPDSAPNSTLTSFVSFANVPGSLPKNSLLNFMEALKPAESVPMLTPTPVSCSTYSFAMDPCWKIYSPTWNFGDGSPVSTSSNVTHTYANSGTYTVSLVLSYNGSPLPAVTRTISVFNAANLSITGPSLICVGSPFLNSYGVSQYPNATYLWSASNATIAGPANASNVSAAGGPAGIATLSVQVSNGGCVAGATKTVNVVNLNLSLNATATLACAGQNVTLTGSPAGGTYTGTSSGNVFNSAATGTYNVSYNYSNSGCSQVVYKSIQVVSCTGLSETESSEGGISLYPNPTNGMLYIRASVKINSYEIVNTLGQQISDGVYSNGIHTETLSDGIYFIHVKTEKGEKVKLKFVKE
jgi:hypothetical protein